jgi:hypothetical protein
MPHQRFIVAKARSTAERTLPAQALWSYLPGLERIAGVLDLPGDPVDQPARFERLAQSLAVISPVGEKALLVALDQRFAQTGIVHIGRGQLGLGAL